MLKMLAQLIFMLKSMKYQKYIIEIDHPKKYTNGLVVFNLFINKFDMIKKFLNYFLTFREYIQFHIHSIKTFL